MGMFTVQPMRGGYRFDLKAGNGQTVAVSPIWHTMRDCLAGIERVRQLVEAPIEDQTVSHPVPLDCPKYEIYYSDKNRLHCFRLKDTDDRILLFAENYTAKRSCKNGIRSVRNNAPEAPVAKDER